jgi:hypothetical protein
MLDACWDWMNRHAKQVSLLSRGHEDFSDFESTLLPLLVTHVADCNPQSAAPLAWDFPLAPVIVRFLQIILGPVGWLRSESGPRANSKMKAVAEYYRAFPHR